MKKAYYLNNKVFFFRWEKGEPVVGGGGEGVTMQEKLLSVTSRDSQAMENNHVFHFNLVINFIDGKTVPMNILNS